MKKNQDLWKINITDKDLRERLREYLVSKKPVLNPDGQRVIDAMDSSKHDFFIILAFDREI